MKKILRSRGLVLLTVTGFLMLLSNSSAMACAACYGDTTGSKMGNAAATGIFAMVIIMFAMLGAVAAFGWHLAYRAKHPLPDYSEMVKDGEAKPTTETPS